MQHTLKPLTPREEAEARRQAHAAFLVEMQARYPQPVPSTRDLVHDNPTVVKALVGSISIMPLFLALIMGSSMVISADKTFAAFSGAAANEGWFWTALIGVLGVVMTEGSMVFMAFAAKRERLQKGLKRRVVTLPAIIQGIKVRLGLTPVPDFDEMPDTALEHFARMILVLILTANIFTAVMPMLERGFTTLSYLELLKLGFAVFMGAVAPFALHSVGAQLAQLSFDLYRQEHERLKRELAEEWRAEMEGRWTLVEEELTQRALHNRFVVKNKLPLTAGSPYLLTAGEEGDLHAVPFEP